MTLNSSKPRLVLAGSIVALASMLAGCGLMVVGGTAATTALVATDRRTAGEQVEDQAIQMKAAAEMRRLFEDTARVNPTSYGGVLLLTGEVPSEEAKTQANAAASNVDKVKRVVNELRVGPAASISARSNDTWLTSKVKSTLINTKEVPTRTMTITTAHGIVYLMGRVTPDEGERAGIAASSVAGVSKVVKLFEFISPDSLRDDTAERSAPSTTPPPASPTSSPDTEAMPIQ